MTNVDFMPKDTLNFGIFIPYNSLVSSPVTFYIDKVPVSLVLTSCDCCTMSIPPLFIMTDSNSNSPDDHITSTHVKVGSSLIISYKNSEYEVRLGRRITINDRSTYI